MNTFQAIKYLKRTGYDKQIIRLSFAGIITGKSIYKYFLGRCFLKTIDDYIDASDKTTEQKAAFLIRIIAVFKGKACPSTDFELFASYFIKRVMKNSEIVSLINVFFDIFEFDNSRRKRNITDEELDWYVNTLGGTSVKIMKELFCKNGFIDEVDIRNLACIYILTDILYDLDEDIAMGYYNFPKQISKTDLNKWVLGKIKILDDKYLTVGKFIEVRKVSFFKIFLKMLYKQKRNKFISIKSRWESLSSY